MSAKAAYRCEKCGLIFVASGLVLLGRLPDACECPCCEGNANREA